MQLFGGLLELTKVDLRLSAGGQVRLQSASSQATGEQILNLPDVPAAGTETLVGLALTQTLTNKTLSGASNTITNVSLTSGVTGTLPLGNGGTGQVTAVAGFNALSPLTTKGDLLAYATTTNGRLPVGTDGQVLAADSTQTLGLKWVAGLTSALTNTHIFVGNASNVATDVAMSGDATLTNAGVLTVAAGAITGAKIANTTITDANVSASAAIAGSKLAAATSSTTGSVSAETSNAYANGGPTLTWTDDTGTAITAPTTYLVRFVRVGSLVTVAAQFTNVNGGAAHSFAFSGAASAYTPSVSLYTPVGVLNVNGTVQTGLVNITTGGRFVFYKSDTTVIGNLNSNTGSVYTCFSYHIA